MQLIPACPLCETAYNPMEARIVGEREDSHLVHIQCKKCLNALLTLVSISPVGMQSVGVITDLTLDDAVRFRESDEVGLDDAIGAHTMLHEDDLFVRSLVGN